MVSVSQQQLDSVPEIRNSPSTSEQMGNSEFETNTKDRLGLGDHKHLFVVKPCNTKKGTLPGFACNQKGHRL